MNRIFLPVNILTGTSLSLTGHWHKQVSVVLRSRPGDRFIAVCGDGFEYSIEITSITARETRIRILECMEINREPATAITLYLGILKASGLEEILPPLVYLGVKAVVPMVTERSQAKLEPYPENRRERIDKIIQRATALCGRTRLMQCEDPVSFNEAVCSSSENSQNLFFWEDAPQKPLRELISTIKTSESTGIFTGPEGGFTQNEAKTAEAAGITPASLGPRILDARTAPIVEVSAILYQNGDI